MADIKPTSVRSGPGVAVPRLSQVARPASARPLLPTRPIQDGGAKEGTELRTEPGTQIVADFIAPAPGTTAWMSDPRLVATLQSAAETLAPNGAAKDTTGEYAVNVIETHLAARRRLSTLMNALLKT